MILTLEGYHEWDGLQVVKHNFHADTTVETAREQLVPYVGDSPVLNSEACRCIVIRTLLTSDQIRFTLDLRPETKCIRTERCSESFQHSFPIAMQGISKNRFKYATFAILAQSACIISASLSPTSSPTTPSFCAS